MATAKNQLQTFFQNMFPSADLTIGPDESRANAALRVMMGLPGDLMLDNRVKRITAPAINWLNERPGEKVAPAPGAAVVPDFSFGTSAAPAPPAPTDIMAQLAALGIVTSGKRTPEDNKRVGGVANSHHLTGEAADLVPKNGQTMAQLMAAVQAAMGGKGKVIDEGDHLHAQWGGVANPTLAPGVPGVMPGVGYIDPGAAMAMLPAPIMNRGINLPDAPVLEAPAARPLLDTIDKAGMLAQLQAFMPEEDDTQGDPWERVKAGLGNMAIAAARTGQDGGLGPLIAAMGGSFAGGMSGKGEEQKAETKQALEARRQFGLMLAKMGVDVDLENLATGNKNKGIDWQSGEDTREVKNKNKLSANERMVQELLANVEIEQGNVAATNSFNTRRAGVGLDAMGGQVSAQNNANEGQFRINNREDRTTAADGYVPGAKEILASVGIGEKAPPKELESAPKTALARQTANFIAANNVEGVINTLADDLLTDAQSGAELPDWLFDKVEAKEVKQAAKKGDAAAVKNFILASLKKPGNGMKAAQAQAAKGSPIGKLITTHNKAK